MCHLGVKTSATGFTQSGRGYQLHGDVADGQIPISVILTSASLPDSPVAIGLATRSTPRVTYGDELMDSAYDAQEITEHRRGLNHVPIVDPNHRGHSQSVIAPGAPQRELSWAEADPFKDRTMMERVNGRLKDEFGGRTIRVRGAVKVMAHLMFGVLALTVDQFQHAGGFLHRVLQITRKLNISPPQNQLLTDIKSRNPLTVYVTFELGGTPTASLPTVFLPGQEALHVRWN